MNTGRRSNRGGFAGREAVERVSLAFWIAAPVVALGSLFAGVREFGSTSLAVVGSGLGAWALGGLAGYAAAYFAAQIPAMRRGLQRDDSNGIDLADLIVPWAIVGVLGMFALIAISRSYRS